MNFFSHFTNMHSFYSWNYLNIFYNCYLFSLHDITINYSKKYFQVFFAIKTSYLYIQSFVWIHKFSVNIINRSICFGNKACVVLIRHINIRIRSECRRAEKCRFVRAMKIVDTPHHCHWQLNKWLSRQSEYIMPLGTSASSSAATALSTTLSVIPFYDKKFHPNSDRTGT